jgi:serine/threonine protein kinase
VYRVEQDARRRVYLFTNRGVARLTPRNPTADDPSRFTVYTFTTDDGLPANECNSSGSFVDARGRIWAGTIAGAAVFDPVEEVADAGPKALVLLPPRAGERARAVAPGESLAHDQNTLAFDYALLSPFREDDTRFRTQLVGFDRSPSEWATDPKTKYTNLPEGRYEFRVWGRDYAGNESGPVSIEFRVKPAPWRTWWAWISYAVALGAAVYGLQRARLRRLREHNRALEVRVAERTAELEAARVDAVRKNAELDRKVAELARKNRELEESHRRADLIFSALADVLPGTVLEGKYRLEEKIGTGGFGAVFRATHVSLGRGVAVKVFRPSPGNDSAIALERFRLEGVSACRVVHPNAVHVFDSGITPEGIAYLVMELLRGHSLAEELKVGKLPTLRRCASILARVCDVLELAHKNGILHRDIKPDNVFLHRAEGATEEEVKVVDFGIAKLMGVEPGRLAGLTGTGALVGTPSYMAPERFTGAGYDTRSDVYSLGVTLFEALTGSLPFPHEGRPAFDILLRQLTAAPLELTVLNALVPTDAARVVMRCLSKDPEARPTLPELAITFAEAIDMLPDDVKDAAITPVRSLSPSSRNVDELAETISKDGPTMHRPKTSRPPPPN